MVNSRGTKRVFLTVDMLKKRLKIRAHGCKCTMAVCMPEQNECKACALKK